MNTVDIGFGIIGLVFFAFAVARTMRRTREKNLVESGHAEYVVQVNASGKDRTYHSLSCGRCKIGYVLTLAEVRARSYAGCTSCGGKASVRRIRPRAREFSSRDQENLPG